MKKKTESKLSFESLMEELEAYENPVSEKQKDILRAAEDLFAEKGYASTPTAEIARKAGVTERTLFKHFRTKGDLIRRIMFPILLKTVLPAQFRQVHNLVRAHYETPKEFLSALAEDRLKAVLQHGPRLKILLTEMIQNDRLRGQFSRLWRMHFFEEVDSVIGKFRDQGAIRSDVGRDTLIRVMISSILGYVLLRGILAPDLKWDTRRDLEETIEILLHGIAAKSGKGA